MKLLDVKDLTIRFGGVVAVNEVSFALEAGETLGVIGPNGSGKTTLFNLLSGIYKPTSGAITLAGKATQNLRTDQVFHLGLSRTFQNGRLFWNLNVLENIMMGLEEVRSTSMLGSVFGLKKEKDLQKQAVEKATKIMGVFGTLLTSQANKLASDLPYADRRRLEICRAIASNPKVILLDEPSAGMDGMETEVLMNDLIKVKEAMPKLSIIVVEHDMGFIRGLVDKVMVLDHGKTIAYGLFDDVASNEAVIKAYLGEEEEAC